MKNRISTASHDKPEFAKFLEQARDMLERNNGRPIEIVTDLGEAVYLNNEGQVARYLHFLWRERSKLAGKHLN